MNWQTETATWCNFTKPHLLKIDQACLHIRNQLDASLGKLELWGQSVKCEECPLWKIGSIKPGESSAFIVNTTYETYLEFKTLKRPSVCNFTYSFEEFGIYSVNTTSTEKCSQISVEKCPANIYLPLLWSALVILTLIIFWVIKCVFHEQRWCTFRSCFSGTVEGIEDSSTLLSNDPASSHEEPNSNFRHRIRSLDTFRGLTIVSMILINYGGGGYWFLHHAPWNGLTAADVVFPCFVWIMGASSVLSLNSQLRRALGRRRILYKILRRAAALFLLGLMLNTLNNNNVNTLRIPGVLQRLSFVYLIVALLELAGLDPEDNQRYSWFASVRDILCSWLQWLVISLCVAANLSITFLLPVSGCPLGYLGPGGLEKGGKFRNCTGGAARVVDEFVFGADHIYQRPTCQNIYDTTVPFDPEGILGSLTSLLCAYLGAEAGKILLLFHANPQRISRWIGWAIITGLIGGTLCSFSINEGPIPINKNLWSISYVLVTSSLAFLILTILYIFIDVLGWWSGAPFRYAGMNALLLYVGHVFAKPLVPFSWSPAPSTHAVRFAMNASASALWLFISWILYRKRVFLTL